jgi:hypothetical protein
MTLELIYKHKGLVDRVLAETEVKNPHFMNPHINIKEHFLLQQSKQLDSESETELWFWISRHPSNFAIQLMKQNIRKINQHGLVGNQNPGIEGLLEKTMHKFKPSDWCYLCKSHNPAAMSFLQKRLKKIDWAELSENQYEGAIQILENNLDKVVWWIVSANPSAIKMIESNMDKVDFYSLCKNPSAIHLIKQNMDKLDDMEFEALSCNPNAIHIVKNNLEKISRFWFSRNPNAISILEENPQFIEFFELLRNPNAISLLEKNILHITLHQAEELVYNTKGIELFQKLFEIGTIPQDDFDYLVANRLQENKSLFDLDYQAMSKIRVRTIYDELISKALHPSRVEQWLNHYLVQGGKIEEFDYV